MQDALTNPADNIEIDNIDVAGDILRRMLRELEELATDNARLHFAISTSGHTIRQRLDMLSGITELLKMAQAPLRARELNRRAKALIFHLAGELEQLSIQTEHDLESSTKASFMQDTVRPMARKPQA
jgi:hypothetical protein